MEVTTEKVREFQVGRFTDISLFEYHSMDGYSKSSLDKINRSMSHLFSGSNEQTESMLVGSAFHCKVLTPDLYEKQYGVIPECDRRTKEGKEIYAKFALDNIGKDLISWKDAANIEKMAESVSNHPVASQLLTEGYAENSFFWVDPQTGLKCKCRPDYVRPSDKIIIDLKTTDDASYWKFQKSIVNYRYHVQGGYFCDGVSVVEKEQYKIFIIIAVESSAPYEVAIYNIDSNALDIGRVAYSLDLKKVEEYLKTNWAGYPCMIQEMFLPSWVN